MKTVTLNTLVADTGETPRTLQHWTDLGILRAEPTTDRQGRGNRRSYRSEPLYGERKYALLASALNKLRLPLVDVKHLIYGERLHFDPIETLRGYAEPAHLEAALRHRAQHEKEFKETGAVFPINAALAGEPNIFAVIAARPHDPATPFQIVLLRQSRDAWDPWDTPAAKANNRLLLNLMAENPAAVVLNLSTIFKPLYSNPSPVEAENEDQS